MKNRNKTALKSVAVYYVQAVVLIVASYGLLLAIYGRARISFVEWTLILLLAFTIGYIPNFVRLFRGNTFS